MSTALPSGPRGRALALAVTALGLAALWLGVLDPVLTWHAERAERLAQLQGLARHMQTIADQLPALQAEAAAAVPADAPQASLLAGASDALAGAALGGLLEAMVSRVGTTLTSSETLQAVPAEGYRRIGLRLSLSAAWPDLIRLMQLIEQASPQMLIDDVQLHAGPMLPEAKSVPLDASFTVFAFRAASASDQGAAKP